MVELVETSGGLLLKIIPRMSDWAGVNVGKQSYADMVDKLDHHRLRRHVEASHRKHDHAFKK